jgi:hypothetical protein
LSKLCSPISLIFVELLVLFKLCSPISLICVALLVLSKLCSPIALIFVAMQVLSKLCSYLIDNMFVCLCVILIYIISITHSQDTLSYNTNN